MRLRKPSDIGKITNLQRRQGGETSQGLMVTLPGKYWSQDHHLLLLVDFAVGVKRTAQEPWSEPCGGNGRHDSQ